MLVSNRLLALSGSQRVNRVLWWWFGGILSVKNPRGLWLVMAMACLATAVSASNISYTEVTPVAGGCAFTGIVGGCTVDSSVAQVFATDVASFATFGSAMGGM